MNNAQATRSDRRPDTRSEIVRTARRLLLSHSYLGLNFQELADRIGIRKASLYHHFPSKLAVGQAVIDDSAQRFQRWSDTIDHLPAAQQLLAYVQMLRGALAAGGMVCPIGATAGEWDGLEPELQDTVKRFHLQQLAWLETRAARLPKPSSPQPGGTAMTPRQWAAHFNATCQGALLNARLHGDLALYDLSVAPLLNQFASAPQA
jgi:TetR/AcrR family transcriptional repressor of nem operon